nr:hypothetical protein [Ktedonobacteraceae bacterium]
MKSKEITLEFLLKRIGYQRAQSSVLDHVVITYQSNATGFDNICDIGTIDKVLAIGNMYGDEAVKRHIKEMIEMLEEQIKRGVANALKLAERTD